MPTNVTAEYAVAELEYSKAGTIQEKIAALKKMLSTCPTHKGTEKLRQQIKTKLAKFKELQEKKLAKKGPSTAIKKEGAAQVVLIGTPNSGKSTLLAKITNAKPLIAKYPFTTTKPEIGVMDYHGVKIQVIEIPALTSNFMETEKGPTFLGIVRTADLIVILAPSDEEMKLVETELFNSEIDIPKIYYEKQENIADLIWQNLGLIKAFTKTPGKKKDLPPVAMKKGTTVKDLAEHVHKDFIKKFKFARVWGKSAKFPGAQTGIGHKLADDDVVEFHTS